MATKSTRTIVVAFTGDFVGTDSLPVAVNANSPVQSTPVTLSSGANTISVPAGSTAVQITPPTTNTNSITFKGVTGDTGVRLHNTQPASIPLDSSVTQFVLTAGATITGVVIMFS